MLNAREQILGFSLTGIDQPYQATAHDRDGNPFLSNRQTFRLFASLDPHQRGGSLRSEAVCGKAAHKWARRLGLSTDRLEFT